MYKVIVYNSKGMQLIPPYCLQRTVLRYVHIFTLEPLENQSMKLSTFLDSNLFFYFLFLNWGGGMRYVRKTKCPSPIFFFSCQLGTLYIINSKRLKVTHFEWILILLCVLSCGNIISYNSNYEGNLHLFEGLIPWSHTRPNL